MSGSSGVFLLKGENTLEPMAPAEFVAEADFQRLLARFPELLVGDQIDPENPRRWILVRREQPVATGELGASQWSVDHLFLDQDGIPTLVEIKRQSDSRIRREVVGQMLDYAANCASYWSAESLKTSFERTCGETGNDADAALGALLGDDGRADEFWQQVKTNLQARKIRLLFVADMIPLELRRIVEFLNEQMDPVEVLAIELRQFEANGLKTIVPTVYGQTQAAAKKRVDGARIWDQQSIFEKLKQTVGPRELELASRIFEWMRKGGRRAVVFGKGKENGSVYPSFVVDGTNLNPIYLSTDGNLWVQFGALQNKPVFGDVECRRQLMERLNRIDGVNFTDADLSRYRTIPLSTITAHPNGADKVIDALTWLGQQIERE